MKSRCMWVKYKSINQINVLEAQKKDKAAEPKNIGDDIYLFQDNENDVFVELEKVFHQLNVSYDCKYQSENESQGPTLIMSYRPDTKAQIFVYEENNKPTECKNLQDCIAQE